MFVEDEEDRRGRPDRGEKEPTAQEMIGGEMKEATEEGGGWKQEGEGIDSGDSSVTGQVKNRLLFSEGGRGQVCDGRIKRTRGTKSITKSCVMEKKAGDGEGQQGGGFRSFWSYNCSKLMDGIGRA